MFGFERTEYDKKVYDEQLRDFLPETFIDIHTHIWKKEFDGQDHTKGCVSWTKLVAEDCTAEDLFQTNRDMFPGKKVIPVLMGQPMSNVYQTNEYTAQCKEKYNLPAFFCTDYTMTGDYLEEQVKKGGFIGLKPYLNNSPQYIPSNELRIYDFLTPEHLEAANKNGWIVMLHIARPGRLRDEVNIAQLMEIEEKYPHIKLIVAHVGRAYSREDLGTAFDVLKNTKNMMFDFTANTLSLAMEQCINAVGTKRLMFGSDLPITKMRMYRITENGFYYNVVPRGLYGDVSGDPHMRETDEKDVTNFMYEELLAFKNCAQTLGLSKTDVEDVLCNNAAKLFNIDTRREML